jgi:hypothetical protein
LILSLLSLYFVKDAITEKRDYEVVIENPDTSVTLSSEDIIYNAENENVKVESDTKQTFTLILKNSSNVPGAAAKLQPELEALGYTVSDLQSDFVETKKRSVIVYSAALSEQALDLSQKLGGVLLSSDAGTSTSEAAITVYIGNDLAERE